MLYTLDWLSFADIVIAIIFIAPMKDPIKNIWVIEFGIISCITAFPANFIFGYNHQIPLIWSFLDCIFGIIGAGLLFCC